MTLVDIRPPVHNPHPAAAPAGRDRRDRSGLASRLAVGASLAVIAAVYSVNLAGWPRYFDDEGTYYSQAWAVQHLGALSPYTYWYDHPPVGWLQLAAFTWLPDQLLDGDSTLLAGRIVMVGYAVTSAGLLYVLARRLGLTRVFSLAAMLLWALNPLVLFEGRQIFLDNVALPWLLGAFVLALNRRQNLGLHMAAGFCFAIAVLSKETTAVFVVPLLLAIWRSAYRPTRAFALVGFMAALTTTGLMYVLLPLIRSELLPGPDHVSLWDALAFQFLEREGSGSVFDADGPDGGAYDTFHSWLDLDPFLLLAGVGAGVVLLLVARLRPVGLAVVIAALVGLRPSGYLPHMYVITLLPFCALALAGLVDLTWRASAGLRGRSIVPAAGFVALVAAAVAVAPYQEWVGSYRTAWTQQVNEPHSRLLEQVGGLPDGARLAVDNTYWNDLVDAGRAREDVVWFFKVDNDATVLEDLGGSYLGLDYLVWTDFMSDNAGPVITRAFEQSVTVWSTGSGDDRVELREVLSVSEWDAREQAKADGVVDQLARERKQLDAYLRQESEVFPGLTNGQLEGIRVEAEQLSVRELALKYRTRNATIRDVLRQPRVPAQAPTPSSGE